MVTRKLWRALNNPPATHPLFRRVVLLPERRRRRYVSWAGFMIGAVMVLGEFMPLLLVMVIPFFISVSGLLYGLECAMRVSGAIAGRREDGSYDLLSLLPQGSLSASWVICTSSLYRQREFDQLTQIVWYSILIALVLSAAFSLMLGLILVMTPFPEFVLPNFMTVFYVVTACAGLYAEYIQSVIIGCLIGLALPFYSGNRLDAGLYAFGVYLLVKMCCYAFVALFGLTILPDLYSRLGWYGAAAEISLMIIRIALLVGIHESVIQALMKLMGKLSGLARPELDVAFNIQ